MDYNVKLSKEFTIRADHAQNIINLIDEGNTIPFIARFLGVECEKNRLEQNN